jgi:hypothetical protein
MRFSRAQWYAWLLAGPRHQSRIDAVDQAGSSLPQNALGYRFTARPFRDFIAVLDR